MQGGCDKVYRVAPTIRTDSGITDWFNVCKGDAIRCIVSPQLFIINTLRETSTANYVVANTMNYRFVER